MSQESKQTKETEQPTKLDLLVQEYHSKYFAGTETFNYNNLRRTNEGKSKEINPKWIERVLAIYKLTLIFPENIVLEALHIQITNFISVDSCTPPKEINFETQGFCFRFIPAVEISKSKVNFKSQKTGLMGSFENSETEMFMNELQAILSSLS